MQWFETGCAIINCERSTPGDVDQPHDWRGLFHEWSKKSPLKYDKDEVDAKLDDISNHSYDYTAGTIYDYANIADPGRLLTTSPAGTARPIQAAKRG